MIRAGIATVLVLIGLAVWTRSWALDLSGGTSVTQMRFDYEFGDYGQLDSGDLMGCYFNELAGTVTKVTLTTHRHTCAVNPTFAVLDCGTTVNVCNAPTTIASATSTGTAVVNVSISAAAVGAGTYVCVKPTAGTCANVDWNYTVHGTIP